MPHHYRARPSSTNASTVTFVVDFNDLVTGVSLADFSLGGTNTNATILSMTGDAVNGSEVFTVTVDTGGPTDNGTIILNYNSANARDFAGNGGEFLGVRTITAPGETGVTVADFNNDGNLDILTGSANAPGLTYTDFNIRFGNGNGTFGAAQDFASNTNGRSLGKTAAGDFNGDGYLDVAVTTRDAFLGARLPSH